jgi:hypothetical protein
VVTSLSTAQPAVSDSVPVLRRPALAAGRPGRSPAILPAHLAAFTRSPHGPAGAHIHTRARFGAVLPSACPLVGSVGHVLRFVVSHAAIIATLHSKCNHTSLAKCSFW